MNPLAIAIQGLGFGLAQIALQGLLLFVAQEVVKYDPGSLGPARRKSRRMQPDWAPIVPLEEDEALLLAGLL